MASRVTAALRRFVATVKVRLGALKWIIVGLGALLGLMAFGLVNMLETTDFTEIANIYDQFPEGLLDMIGGVLDYSTPYGILNTHFFQMMWMYLGLFLLFVASFALPVEFEHQTIDLVLSKPVSRQNFLGAIITSLYGLLASTLGIALAITAGAMVASPSFQAYGLYWDRLGVAYGMTLLHLGALMMIAVLVSTLLQDSKRTAGVAVVVFFVLYFLGVFSGMLPEAARDVKWVSVWTYYRPQEFIQAGDFTHLPRDAGVLLGLNVALVVASLVVFARKDVPV